MRVGDFHLTYCTNIHPGESWAETFAAWQTHVPGIRAQVAPEQPFGLGLRLSDLASREIWRHDGLEILKDWLAWQNCYVFTINGFPFGGFHRTRVKDDVHRPDWTDPKRLGYTQRLFRLLGELLPPGQDGGISTSPLSYAPWWSDPAPAYAQAAHHLGQLVADLWRTEQDHGQWLHLDLEPEPDGLLEDTPTTLAGFTEYLFPLVAGYLRKRLQISLEQAEEVARRHLRVCYDVCHFAVAFEDHAQALAQLAAAGIGIGKFQISAALRVPVQQPGALAALARYHEPTYLHQTVARLPQGPRLRYPDLDRALAAPEAQAAPEWRVHYHVPIFLAEAGPLQTTQPDLEQVLALPNLADYSRQLEVETYTWDILPSDLQLPIGASVARELEWVRGKLAQR
ncbi:MAG: metabolite traffic protein EboE [Bernardetiaceae bacterium]|jgi:hypothetical protein|nr:metabolite traffic protein EboE [Bernardetiaceae bacterium]